MVKIAAIQEAIKVMCRGYEIKVGQSKSTNSFYVLVSNGSNSVTMRFSDHKGKNPNLACFLYNLPKANFKSLQAFIANNISKLNYIYRQNSFSALFGLSKVA